MLHSDTKNQARSGRLARQGIASSFKMLSRGPRSKGVTAFVAGGLLMATVVAIPLPALADTVTVTNAVVAGDGSKSVTTAPGVAKAVSYTLTATNNDPINDLNGCNAGNGTNQAVTVTIQLPAGLTATTSDLTFIDCVTQSVTFTASSAGDYSVTAGASGGKNSNARYTTTGATFTMHVVSPNLPPTVTVTGVLQGAGYEPGSVPVAMCNVTDDNDAARTFAATITGSLDGYGLGSQTAACSATDTGELTSTASAAYSIVDTTKPILTVPGDITREATGTSGATVTYSASATDAVDGSPTVTCSAAGGLGSGSTFPFGDTLVTCTATDVAGNHDSKQFTITVQDKTPPILTLPASITKEATGPSGATVTYSASATDNIDGAVTPSCAPASATTFGITTTPVKCTATDAHLNPSTGSFDVTVQDTTKPTLTLPANQTLEAAGPGGTGFVYSATATDAVSGSPAVTCDYLTGTVFPIGTTTVSCSSIDANTNTATGSFTVTVVDTTNPVLTLPGNISEEANKPTGKDITYSVSASDLVKGNVVPACSPANGTFVIGTTTVNCTATDDHNNTATGSFTITVVDTTAPVFSAGPGAQTKEATSAAGAVVSFPPPTASDLVDEDRPVSCKSSSGLGSGDTFPLGTTAITCTAADTRGNTSHQYFDITVADTIAPVLSIPENMTPEATSPTSTTVTFTSPTATDAVSGSPAVTCDPTSGFPFTLDEVTTVKCWAADSTGNVGHSSFTVTVKDTKGPVFGDLTSITKEATSPDGATATWADITATDVVNGPRPSTCDPASGSLFHLGDPTAVTCTAIDTHLNKGVGGFTVTVVDTTAPTLTVPSDLTVEATGPGGAAVTFTPTATDLVDVTVTPACAPASGSTFPLGTTTVTCSATDAHNNISPSQSFTITVLDRTAPTLTVSDDTTLEAISANGAPGTFTATATDLVDGAITPTCTPASGSTFPLGPTTVTCTATDAHNNTGTKSFTMTVVDTTNPDVTVPANMTMKATSSSGAPATFTASASDLVDGTLSPTCTPASGSTFPPGTTPVTCTATDAHNNTGTASFTVTVWFDWNGFFAPVDNKILNGMKAGSTAPIKFSISNQSGGYVSDLTIVNKATSRVAACTAGAPVDPLEVYATGGTQLRYDSTAHQFIYNWQSPKKPGTCYTVTIELTDGTAHSASFQLK